MAVLLDGKRCGDAACSGNRDPGDVVPCEVHEHRVLCLFFGVEEEPYGKPRIELDID